MIFELCSFLVTTEREDLVSKKRIPNEARKSRVFFRVVVTSFFVNFVLIETELVTPYFCFLYFFVVFRIITRKTLLPLIFSSYFFVSNSVFLRNF